MTLPASAACTLPEVARARLGRLAAQDAGPETMFAAAFAHFGRAAAAYVLTATGRTVAATEGARALSAEEAVAALMDGSGTTVPVDAEAANTPYERLHLYLPDPDAAPPRMLHEVAAILGRSQEARTRRRAAARRAVDELGTLLARSGAEATDAAAALRTCGLPVVDGPYQVVTAEMADRREGLAEGALAEASHTWPGRDPRPWDGSRTAPPSRSSPATSPPASARFGRSSPDANRPCRCTAAPGHRPQGWSVLPGRWPRPATPLPRHGALRRTPPSSPTPPRSPASTRC
ncbi:hypothetical protein OIA45_02585 [Streptomyces chartreusis]|uniref:hypothetical protein n=1 Tax=Streptomyces chartreusis TaxID=1969 RepID=UPI00386D34FD|nr:hypothetical protein OIA45_02585 [Streptomyces chartreusis]